ncbi:MAG: 2'-5' RNA ligase family protein, partial [Nitriliruptorales bacterium]
MRLFVALEVPDDVRGDLDLAVAPLRDELDRLRWTPPAQWHVTLAFLGHVEVGIDQIVDVLAAPARDAPPGIGLELGEPGRFGKRVLWVG